MSDLDVKCLVSDEDDRHHQEWSSHTSSSSSSLLSSSYCTSPSCSVLKKTSDFNDERFSPDEESTPACALQTVSMETTHHPGSKRKRVDNSDGPTHTEIQLFSEKCSKLQCFVPPLSSILKSLQSGRYSHRLSSFQESLAMDRILRILGVLQNPESGSRFLHILLKIEEMLQKWFPHIRPTPDEDAPTKRLKHQDATTTEVTSTHLLWLHTSPICSMKTPDVSPSEHAASSCCCNMTQDNVVSSTTDSFSPQKHTQLLRISSPCLERLLQAKESTTPHTDGAVTSSLETDGRMDGWTDEP
ncbi:circadian-associated transcriptional repressor-like [Gouania willdenowi]|uniref:circadian-associated transcriptional repressor-like n=1 Tax=Gouania willdenowi TaxID=441366 RepID=UPI0010548032|nr:circadian-associated transcriptional repressor-like [Gouania willdenowi]